MDGGRLFTMNTDYVCSSFDKIWHSLIGFHNHLQEFKSTSEFDSHSTVNDPYEIIHIEENYQMHVQRKICYRAQGINH